MADTLRQVGLEFVVKGEADAAAKLKTFQHQQDQVTKSILEGSKVTQRIERDIVTLQKALDRGTIGEKAHKDAIAALTREYRLLNEGVRGNQMSSQKATAEVQKLVRAVRDDIAATKAAAAEKKALKAAQDAARAADKQAADQKRQTIKAERDAAREAANLRRQYEGLLNVINPLQSVQVRYEQQLEMVTRYHRMTGTSAEELTADIDRLKAAFARAGTPINEHGQAVQTAGKRFNRFGLVMQQTGYQVGDFLVQVQSGTNVFMAFGQQATQLAGLLYLIPGAMGILAGTILSIAIPAITAFVGWWTRSSEEMKKSKEKASELEKQIESLSGKLNDWVTAKEAAASGITIDELIGGRGVKSAEQAIKDAQKAFDDLVERIRNNPNLGLQNAPLDFITNALQPDGVLGGTDESEALQKAIKAREEAEKILAETSARIRQEAREKAEEAERDAWERQIRERALAEYNAAQDEIARRKQWAEEAFKIFKDAQIRMSREAEAERQARAQSDLDTALAYYDQVVAAQQAGYTETEKTRKETEELAKQVGVALAYAVKFSDLDMSGGITLAAIAASNLAANMKLALASALDLDGLGTTYTMMEGSDGAARMRKYAGRGTVSDHDPTIDGKSIYAPARRSGGGGGSKTDDDAAALERLVKALEKATTGQEKYNEAVEVLNKARAKGLISEQRYLELLGKVKNEYDEIRKVFADAIVDGEEFNRLIAEQTVSVVDDLATAWGDFVVNGFDDFKGFTDKVLNSFKSMISTMIATATRNSIFGALGFGGFSGGGGGAASAVGGGGGTSNGLLGGFLGSKLLGGGGFLGGVGQGLAGVFSGGGIGSSFANLGGLVSGGVSGAGAIGAALPAFGIIAGAVALLIKGLTRKYAGTAIRGELGSEGFNGNAFDFYKGGFLVGNKATYKDAPTELVAFLDTAMKDVTKSVEKYAGILGLSADKISNLVGTQFTVWLNDKSPEEILQALQSEVDAVANEMAAIVLGTDEFSRAGEDAMTTLTRLGTGLAAVNDAADLLGHRIWDVSLASADAASELVDLFGGLEAMTSAVSAYWQAFYSDAERTETLIRRLGVDFADLGLAMPQSRAQFRALVEGIDTTTSAGRELYAELINMSAAMDQVLPQLAAVTLGMQGLVDEIGGVIGDLLDEASANAQDAAAAARLWYRTAETLRSFIRDLTNSDLTAASPAQQLATNRARFDTAFGMVKGGDQQAAADLPGLARAYLESLKVTSGSSLEYRRSAGKVLGDVNFAAGISELQGGNEDVLRGLYEKQITVLENLSSLIQSGELDGKSLRQFNRQLKGLGDVIEEVKDFSYDKVLADLDVTIGLAAKGPKWLERLAKTAGEDIRTTLDFVIRRNDLTPPMRWIAANTVSEHVKGLKFLVKRDLGERTKKIAFETESALRKSLRFIVAKDLDDETKMLALAGNSELQRTVVAALRTGKKADQDALKLALGNIGAYTVNVDASLENLKDGGRAQRIVLKGQGEYAAMVTAALDMLKTDPVGARVLLRQQGKYTAIVGAILDMGDAKKRLLLNDETDGDRTITTGLDWAKDIGDRKIALLLNAATSGIRNITLAAAFGDKMPKWQKLALEGIGGTTLTTLQAAITTGDIDGLGKNFLKGLLGEDIQRKLTALLDDEGITDEQRDYITALTGKNATRTLTGKFKDDGIGDGWTFLRKLATGDVTRTIIGEVDLSGIKGNRKTLLDAITGASAGTITLGGEFTFTPGEAFKEYFSGQRDKFASAVNPLTGSDGLLKELGKALASNTQAVKDDTAAAKMLQIAQLQATGAQIAETAAGLKAGTGGVAGTLNELFRTYGVQQNGGMFAAGSAGKLANSAKSFTALGGSFEPLMNALRAQYGVTGGTLRELVAGIVAGNNDPITSANQTAANLRKQIRDLGGVPSFDGGGYTGDWARSGGVDGKGGRMGILHPRETVLTHGDVKSLVAEMRGVRQEMNSMRKENNEGNVSIFREVRKERLTTDKWDKEGLPETRT